MHQNYEAAPSNWKSPYLALFAERTRNRDVYNRKRSPNEDINKLLDKNKAKISGKFAPKIKYMSTNRIKRNSS